MKKQFEYGIILILIILNAGINIYFQNNTDNAENIESFHIKRQVDSILETGKPIYNDELSYSGRQNIFSPGYYYVMAFSSIVMTRDIAFSFLPILFMSLTIILIYLITKKITNNGTAACFSAFMCMFIPVYNLKTINTISPYTLIILLFFACLYFFSIADETNNKAVMLFIGLLTLLSLVSANVFILILSMLSYIFILKIEGMKLNKVKKELMIFSVFLALWIQFMIYKNALLLHGPYIIWQNIPFELIIGYFSEISIINIIYYIGIMPFFCGLYIIYKYTFKIKNEQLYLYTALTSVIAFLLLFRLIELKIGLIYLGFCFVIFFSLFYKNFSIYISKTKFNRHEKYILLILLVIFFFTSIMPSIALLNEEQKTEQITSETLNALEWIKNNTHKDSIVLGTINEGYLITGIAERKNVIDRNFLMILDINERVKDIRTIYTSASLVKAIELLDYYNVNYILLDDAKYQYNIEDLRYSGSDCIELVYDEDIKIYKVLCRVEIYG